MAQEPTQCKKLNTPNVPPRGVVDQAGYGAPCSKNPCQAGMSCCINARRKLVCEGMRLPLI